MWLTGIVVFDIMFIAILGAVFLFLHFNPAKNITSKAPVSYAWGELLFSSYPKVLSEADSAVGLPVDFPAGVPLPTEPTPAPATKTSPKKAGSNSNASSGNTTTSNTARRMAWIYPGEPACNAMNEYKKYKIDTLMPEYFKINSAGRAELLTVENAGCNGYSAANVASVKANSREQYVTVSGYFGEIGVMLDDPSLRGQFVTDMTNWTVANGFTGVDIDFEEYNRWTANDYVNFKQMLRELGDSLHSKGKKLQVDLPAINSSVTQGYYKLKYEDLNDLPIDQYTIMTYDYHFDQGGGTAVQPISWLKTVIDWSKSKFNDDSKISIGINSYGYGGACGNYDSLSNLTYDQLRSKPGFSTATRDNDSKEMKWKNGANCYFYTDSTALDTKLAAVQAKGITRVSVWHLGGNMWFSN